jgi:hypothetical protein
VAKPTLYLCSNFGKWNLRFTFNITTAEHLTPSHFPFLQIRATGPTTGTRLEGRSPGSEVIHTVHRGTVVRALLRRAPYSTGPRRVEYRIIPATLVEISGLSQRSALTRIISSFGRRSRGSLPMDQWTPRDAGRRGRPMNDELNVRLSTLRSPGRIRSQGICQLFFFLLRANTRKGIFDFFW